MSRTFRRTNIGNAIASKNIIGLDELIIIDGNLKVIIDGCILVTPWRNRGNTPEVYMKRTNFRFFTDNYGRYSVPKTFRKVNNPTLKDGA